MCPRKKYPKKVVSLKKEIKARKAKVEKHESKLKKLKKKTEKKPLNKPAFKGLFCSINRP
ncbi:MAG: hypothetical protein CMI02_12580 [Oceanospirillaceae bacterium]|nr:hypothetical protein [Oceanospirillaceae bacterium]